MDSYTLENVVKGVANHYRIDILFLLSSNPDLSVEEIANHCGAGYKTIAVHLRKMTSSGLVEKRQYGRRKEHNLSNRGKQVLSLLRTIK